MTKRELVQWLKLKKEQVLSEVEAESQKKEEAVIEQKLKSLGFYQMTEQVQSHLNQAWELWSKWKDKHCGEKLTIFSRYTGFEHQISGLFREKTPIKELMERDIHLRRDEQEAIDEERRNNIIKSADSYCAVINNVSACKNAKEAENYVKSLGFDLAETKNQTKNVDTAYLFLKQAA